MGYIYKHIYMNIYIDNFSFFPQVAPINRKIFVLSTSVVLAQARTNYTFNPYSDVTMSYLLWVLSCGKSGRPCRSFTMFWLHRDFCHCSDWQPGSSHVPTVLRKEMLMWAILNHTYLALKTICKFIANTVPPFSRTFHYCLIIIRPALRQLIY